MSKPKEPMWIECEVDCDEGYFHLNVEQIEGHEDRDWDNSMKVEFIEKSAFDAQAAEIEKLRNEIGLVNRCFEDLANCEAERDAQAVEIERLEEIIEAMQGTPGDYAELVMIHNANVAECDKLKAEIEKLRAENEHLEEVIEIKRIGTNLVLDAVQSLQSKCEIYEAALKFYAEAGHFEECEDCFETVSGEPENWLSDADGKLNLENGGIARQAILDASKIGEAK